MRKPSGDSTPADNSGTFLTRSRNSVPCVRKLSCAAAAFYSIRSSPYLSLWLHFEDRTDGRGLAPSCIGRSHQPADGTWSIDHGSPPPELPSSHRDASPPAATGVHCLP